jgi:ubiquinone/menaquinone biosynthesis C-methylase UbiE
MQENWINPSDVENLDWVIGRNRLAENCSNMDIEEVLKKYLAIVYLSPKDVEHILTVIKKIHGNIFCGVGLELGAGVAIFASILSKEKLVEKVYGVELVPNVVRLIQPRVAKKYGDINKFIPTLGSFDEIRLGNESCNFIVEYDSFHHSFDLEKTLREAYRVLKPGGVVVAIDRIQHDGMCDDLKNRLLNYKYDEKWLVENNYSKDSNLTREMNGEHEIRESEWVEAFKVTGFSEVSVTFMARPSLKLYMYSLISMMPDFIKKKTRYKILSAHPFYKTINSFFIRQPKEGCPGGFIGCLGGIESRSVMVKGLIVARKPIL